MCRTDCLVGDRENWGWEPAKWVARLRSLKTDDKRLLLKTHHMGAGHGGPSGRYDYLHEIAFVYAFILDMIGAETETGNLPKN